MRNKLRLATWIVCLLAIMVSFACVITAANNIVENNAKVIFISGTGDDANSGLSPKQAVRHLQKATELLNGAGGTIVFSGDVLENTCLLYTSDVYKRQIRNRWYRILRLWYIPVHISILSLETALTR